MKEIFENWIKEQGEDYGIDIFYGRGIVQKFAEYYHNLQLHKTQVSCSVCCDNQKLSWDKQTISIDDKHGSYKDLSFNFCENCGQTFNVEFS